MSEVSDGRGTAAAATGATVALLAAAVGALATACTAGGGGAAPGAPPPDAGPAAAAVGRADAPAAPPAPSADATAGRVRALLAERDPDAAARLGAALVADGAAAEDLVAAFVEGIPPAADAPRGWIERTYAGADGAPRPWVAWAPEDGDAERPRTLVVDLHGGVGRQTPLTAAELRSMEDHFWAATARERGWILVVPAGMRGAEWWRGPGHTMVLDLVREAKSTWNVDDDRVFATGFSDGGSGSFYLALAARSPFAGFVPLSGHPGVAGAGGLQVHLRGLLDRPVYAVNTDLDSLYPSAALRPVFRALEDLGAPTTWREVTGFRHDPTYLGAERPALLAWMDGVRRVPFPSVVHWEGADPDRAGEADWIAVRALAAVADPERRAFPDLNPVVAPPRPRLGFVADEAHEGPGVRVASVADPSPAAAAGLRPGDVITAIGDAGTPDFPALRAVLARSDHGTEFRLRVLRDGAEAIVEGRFPEAEPAPVFRRERPWGALRAEARGNLVEVAAEGVAAFDLLVWEGAFDLAQPISVHVNGALAFHGRVARDPALIVGRALRDRDRRRVVVAGGPLTVPAPARATEPR